MLNGYPRSGPHSLPVDLSGIQHVNRCRHQPDCDQNGVGCVAESRDGCAIWNKPALNLVAQPVRLRFVRKDADLYSIRFTLKVEDL